MVADGLLTRQRYREVPPRVDYELTERSRDLMPVLGALARWGYDWTWSGPRQGEDVNLGAIFRLAPGLLEPPPGTQGTVDLVVQNGGDDRTFRLIADDGRVEITERPEAEADAVVTGRVEDWVAALGPEGGLDTLDVSGQRGLAEAVLDGFTAIAAARAAQRAA
jgi:HxlR-like helix-turn-helix